MERKLHKTDLFLNFKIKHPLFPINRIHVSIYFQQTAK